MAFWVCAMGFTSTARAANTTIILSEGLTPSMTQVVTTSQRFNSRTQVHDTITLKRAGLPSLTLRVSKVSNLGDENGTIEAIGTHGELMLLSYDGETVYGSLAGNGMRYSITSNASGVLEFTDQTHENFPDIDLGEDGVLPGDVSASRPGIELMEATARQQLEATAQAGASRSRIGMLILFSAEFGQGFSSPIARINQLLSFTNSSMQRSGIDVEFFLANARQVNFNNNAGVSTLLNQARNGGGPFSNVEQLRTQFGADMVAVLSFQPGFSANGVAFVNGSRPEFAFSVTRLSPGCCDSVFAHELGHNMGSGHERVSVNSEDSQPCTGGFTQFACGHGNTRSGPNTEWGTIMSRLNSRRVNNLYSNPGLSCLGEPCGVPAGQANSADNFATFNMSRLLVQNFRGNPVAPPPGPTTPSPRPRPDAITISPVVNLLLDDD